MAKPPARPPPDPTAPDAAVRWFRDRLILTDDEFQALQDATHELAFTIADVNQLDLVTEVWEALDSAIANGETLDDFQERVSDRLASAWGGEEPWRVENIFRTNAQSAYAAGRYEQMSDPPVKAARPYWRFSAVNDARTTLVCQDSDDVILAADHPWWQGHYPPLHFQCRSHAVTLSEEEAQGEGITPNPPATPAMEGFGMAPSSGAEDFEADANDYPAPLWREYGS